MAEEFEDFGQGGDLAVHFVFDLSFHEGELLGYFLGVEVAADFDELATRFGDFTGADKLPRGIGHEG